MHVKLVVKEPEDLVNENEVIVEEMPLDQNLPDDDGEKFDPEVTIFVPYKTMFCCHCCEFQELCVFVLFL